MVLHFCCTITISKLTGIPHRDVVVENIIEDIRKNRCRSLSNGEIASLLEDINEEMFAGSRQMFRYLLDEKQEESKHLTDEEIWSHDRRTPKQEDGWSREVEVSGSKHLVSLYWNFPMCIRNRNSCRRNFHCISGASKLWKSPSKVTLTLRTTSLQT